jgi:hypothetical protein
MVVVERLSLLVEASVELDGEEVGLGDCCTDGVALLATVLNVIDVCWRESGGLRVLHSNFTSLVLLLDFLRRPHDSVDLISENIQRS